MREDKNMKLAVLIDADNISYKPIKEILEEIAKLGLPTIKRAYGDWTKTTFAGWKDALLENAIQPMQQYAYTMGKNSTDSALIIDAMDILHDDKVDGFCILSSDSDFTRLATRLRESGKLVVGMGEKKTPSPFISACDKFVYIENLSKGIDPKKTSSDVHVPFVDNEKIDGRLIRLIKRSIEDLADDNGWAFLAEVGALIIKKKPDFDPRNYGFPKLTPLIKSLGKHFDVDERGVERTPHIKHIYVKIKDVARPPIYKSFK